MIQKRTQVENLTSGFLSTPVFLVSLFTFTPNLKPGWFTLSAQTSGYCYINWFKDFAINTSINTFKKTSINIPINISINTFYFELDDFYYCSILALYIFFCKLKLIYKQPKPKKGTLIFNFFYDIITRVVSRPCLDPSPDRGLRVRRVSLPNQKKKNNKLWYSSFLFFTQCFAITTTIMFLSVVSNIVSPTIRHVTLRPI